MFRRAAETKAPPVAEVKGVSYPKSLSDWQDEIEAWATRKGWPGRSNPIPVTEACALLHSEVSEAYEEHRAGHAPDEVYYKTDKHGQEKPEGIPTEFADIAIRLLHYSSMYGFDLESEIRRKMAFNEQRPYRHGDKVA